MIEDMKAPLFIRPLTENERRQVQAGLRSSDAFVLRRCQIVLASDRGERAAAIAKQLGCHKQTVLNVIHGFFRKLDDERLYLIENAWQPSSKTGLSLFGKSVG